MNVERVKRSLNLIAKIYRKILDPTFQNVIPIAVATVETSKKDYDYAKRNQARTALHALIYHAQSEDYTLCIDEPQNFVTLPEIQPWHEDNNAYDVRFEDYH